ncbi:MAG: Ig-like domain-containing protein [Prevotellaceae bacterium]|jgi:hypothetical protein|nr:Ig-like domain-containing protein [Prevotellaceae bacterium]
MKTFTTLQKDIATKKSNVANGWKKRMLPILLILFGLFFANSQTNAATYYFNTGNLNAVGSWKSNADGTGTSPANFTTRDDIFIVPSGKTATSGSTMTFGAGTTLWVQSGGTVQQTSNITMNATATFKMDAGAKLIQNSTNNSSIVGGIEDWDPASIVSFAKSGIFTVANITGGTYPSVEYTQATNMTPGNLQNVTKVAGDFIINASANITFNENRTIAGNLIITKVNTFLINAGKTISVEGDVVVISGTATNNGTLYYCGTLTGTVGGTGTTTKDPKCAAPKDLGCGTVTMADWVCGATAANPVPDFTCHGSTSVTYHYKVQGAADGTYSTTKPADAGNYTVRASFAANDTHEANTATADFTITKSAAPTSVAGTYTASEGQTVSQIQPALPAGWTWVSGSTTISGTGVQIFQANFSGDDCQNAATNVNVTVTISAADVIAPTLSTNSPLCGTANQSNSGSIVLTFSENVKIANQGGITLSGATKGTATASGSTVTIPYSAAAWEGTVTVSIAVGAIQDIASNNYDASAFNCSFSIMAEPADPWLTINGYRWINFSSQGLVNNTTINADKLYDGGYVKEFSTGVANAPQELNSTLSIEGENFTIGISQRGVGSYLGHRSLAIKTSMPSYVQVYYRANTKDGRTLHLGDGGSIDYTATPNDNVNGFTLTGYFPTGTTIGIWGTENFYIYGIRVIPVAELALTEVLTSVAVNVTNWGYLNAQPQGYTAGKYPLNTVLELTATPIGTNAWIGWSEDLTGEELTKSLTMNANKAVTATSGACGITTPGTIQADNSAVCSGVLVTLSANAAATGTIDETIYQKSTTDASSGFVDMGAGVTTDNPTVNTWYRARYYNIGDDCSKYSPAIQVSITPPTVANAGADNIAIINTTIQLSATASAGGVWTIKAGSPSTDIAQIAAVNSATSNFTPTATGTYTLVWTVSNICGGTVNDEVNIVVSLPPLDAPTGLEVPYTCTSRADLEWDPVAEAEDGYKVYVEKCIPGIIGSDLNGPADVSVGVNDSKKGLRSLDGGNLTITTEAGRDQDLVWNANNQVTNNFVVKANNGKKIAKIVVVVSSGGNNRPWVGTLTDGTSYFNSQCSPTTAKFDNITLTFLAGANDVDEFIFGSLPEPYVSGYGCTGCSTSSAGRIDINAIQIWYKGVEPVCTPITGSPFETTNTEYTVNTLDPNSNYHFKVEAIRGGDTTPSEWVDFSTSNEACCDAKLPSHAISKDAELVCDLVTLTATGTPANGDTWYWQTASDGTSTDYPATTPYGVSSDKAGYYYLRAYNGTCWSAPQSIEVQANAFIAITSADEFYVGDVLTLTANVTGTFYVENPGVTGATIVGNQLTVTGIGMVTVRFESEDGCNVIQYIQVVSCRPFQGENIALSKTISDGSFSLLSLVTTNNQTTPSFINSKAGVANIDASGNVTPKRIGSTTITINYPEDATNSVCAGSIVVELDVTSEAGSYTYECESFEEGVWTAASAGIERAAATGKWWVNDGARSTVQKYDGSYSYKFASSGKIMRTPKLTMGAGVLTFRMYSQGAGGKVDIYTSRNNDASGMTIHTNDLAVGTANTWVEKTIVFSDETIRFIEFRSDGNSDPYYDMICITPGLDNEPPAFVFDPAYTGTKIDSTISVNKIVTAEADEVLYHCDSKSILTQALLDALVAAGTANYGSAGIVFEELDRYDAGGEPVYVDLNAQVDFVLTGNGFTVKPKPTYNTGDHSGKWKYSTQYRLAIYGGICDIEDNATDPGLNEGFYTIFKTLPEPAPIIKVEEVATKVDAGAYAASVREIYNNDQVNMGIAICGTGKITSKIFRITNTGTGDLTVTDFTASAIGTNYTIAFCDRNGNNIATPDLEVNTAGDTLYFRVTFTFPTAAGEYEGTSTIISDDINGNENFRMDFEGQVAQFALPYTYESGYTGSLNDGGGLHHDIASEDDLPCELDMPKENVHPAYRVFQVEGNCMPSPSSALRVGTENKGTALTVNIPAGEGVGEVVIRWCANGYRRAIIKVDGEDVLQMKTFLVGEQCYEHSVLVNKADAATVTIEFEPIDPTKAVLTTLYYLYISPYNSELKSPARDITEFEVVGVDNKNIRIYDSEIFVTFPSDATDEQLKSINISKIVTNSLNSTICTETDDTKGITPCTATNTNYKGTGTPDDPYYYEYTVTAEDGQTKDYKVYVDKGMNLTCPAGGTEYKDSITFSIPMNNPEILDPTYDEGKNIGDPDVIGLGEDQWIEIVEISNGCCVVPVSGEGSRYVIHYLDHNDTPIQAKVAGPTAICIGTTAEYNLVNIPETNNPVYEWRFNGDAYGFSFVGPTNLSKVNIKAPALVTDVVSVSLSVSFRDENCNWMNDEVDFEIKATSEPPAPVLDIEMSPECLTGGMMTLHAQGSDDATSYSWEFSPATLNDLIVRRVDSMVVLNLNGYRGTVDVVRVTAVNACGETESSKAFPSIDYANPVTTWTGRVSNNWNDHNNWTARVPKSCTDVIIPDVSKPGVNYPVINYAPVKVTGNEEGVCRNITFKSGAGVLGLEFLTYEKAFVDVTLERGKWYTLTAPLKEMVSGDYYFNGGAPISYQSFFDVTIDKGGSVKGHFDRPFATLNTPLDPGRGYAFKIDEYSWNYPNGTEQTTGAKTISFPRMNKDSSLITAYIPYSQSSGRPIPAQTASVSRSQLAYHFAAENGAGELVDVTVPLTPEAYNLVGNPLMTHLNITHIVEDHGHLTDGISGVFLWDGERYLTYDSETNKFDDDASETTNLAPMQSFVVHATSGNPQITFHLADHFTVCENISNLRNATVNDPTLMLSIDRKQQAKIIMKEGASNKYVALMEDNEKIFTKDIQEVATMVDEQHVAFNRFGSPNFSTPVYVSNPEKGAVTLRIEGANNFADEVDVYLRNELDASEVELKPQGDFYAVNINPAETNGKLWIEFRGVTTDKLETRDSEITVTVKDGNTIVATASPDNLISEMTVMDETGRTIVRKTGIEATQYEQLMNNGLHVYMVRVVTEREVKVAKVLIR